MKKPWYLALVAVVFALLLGSAAQSADAQTSSKGVDYGPYAFGTLTSSIPSVAGYTDGGYYYRYIRNDTGAQATVKFVNLSNNKGPSYTLKKGQKRWIHVSLGKSKNTHYAILLMGSELTLSGGVWTPKMTHVHYANKSRHWDIVCSTNPLKVKAIFNVRKASMGGSWKLADYTAKWIKPGHSACLTAHQRPGRYMRLRSEWRHYLKRSNQTYEVAPIYYRH